MRECHDHQPPAIEGLIILYINKPCVVICQAGIGYQEGREQCSSSSHQRGLAGSVADVTAAVLLITQTTKCVWPFLLYEAHVSLGRLTRTNGKKNFAYAVNVCGLAIVDDAFWIFCSSITFASSLSLYPRAVYVNLSCLTGRCSITEGQYVRWASINHNQFSSRLFLQHSTILHNNK